MRRSRDFRGGESNRMRDRRTDRLIHKHTLKETHQKKTFGFVKWRSVTDTSANRRTDGPEDPLRDEMTHLEKKEKRKDEKLQNISILKTFLSFLLYFLKEKTRPTPI